MSKLSAAAANMFYGIISFVYLIYFAAASGIFLLCTPILTFLSLLLEHNGLDGAIRRIIYFYGHFTMAIWWPYIRYEVTGKENQPGKGPVVYVINHRSAADAYFSATFALCHTIMFVRSWPFKIPIYGTIMKLGEYVDVENTSVFEFIENQGKKLIQRNVSMLFFPEGHRSPDGRMRRFHSGAFFLACEFNLPVVPVCIKGTENFLSRKHPTFRPSKVHIHIMPSVFPETISGENRVVELKRDIHSTMQTYLGE